MQVSHHVAWARFSWFLENESIPIINYVQDTCEINQIDIFKLDYVIPYNS